MSGEKQRLVRREIRALEMDEILKDKEHIRDVPLFATFLSPTAWQDNFSRSLFLVHLASSISLYESSFANIPM